MSNDYIGWKMFDTVTIVSRPITRWNYEKHETIATGECQGFLVDPKNKKQLESALHWGTTYNHIYEEVDGMFVQEIIDYTAIGEGEAYALAALHLGHSVEEAVQVACDLCCYVSEPIVKFTVEE